MNVVVIIFYSICGAWLIVLSVLAIVKKVKFEKQKKQLKDELKNDETRKKTISESEN